MFKAIKTVLNGGNANNGMSRLKNFGAAKSEEPIGQTGLASSNIAALSTRKTSNRYQAMRADKAELQSRASVNYAWTK